MPPGRQQSIPDGSVAVPADLLVDLSRGFGALTEAVQGHAQKDAEQHTSIMAGLKDISDRVAKLEDKAVKTGEYQAIQVALETNKKARWLTWEKVLTGLGGAALAAAGAALHHFLGWK